MAARKRSKSTETRKGGTSGSAARATKRNGASKVGKAARAPAPEARTRVIPLAALRATLGTEVDRVRTYGGHTLILRRGRPVAAVIPYHEYERFIMDNNNRGPRAKTEGSDGAPEPRMTPAEIMAEVDRVRDAIARADAERAARSLPVNTKSAAELIREIREERTAQILQAARGKA
jgi:prevent-host-death family protein